MSFLRLMLISICIMFISTEAASGEDVKKAVGDEVSFTPASAIPTGASIIWKHRSDSGVFTKVIEYDEDGENIPNPNFNGITTLDVKTGEITIKNLTPTHRGVYTIDINSKEQAQRFFLTVMERVPKPVIKPEKIPNNAEVVYIRCEYSETIIWRNSDGETLNGSVITPIGESLTVHKEGIPEKSYTCSLKNDVSEETSEPLYERDLFTGNPFPWTFVGYDFRIIISILACAGAILLLLISVLICYACRSFSKHKKHQLLEMRKSSD